MLTLQPILPKFESSDTAIANPPLEQSCTDLTDLFFINDNTACMLIFESLKSTHGQVPPINL